MDAPENLRITIDDIRKAGYCARGAKVLFAGHNIDFAAFLKEGMTARDFLAVNDAYADKVVQAKLKREGLV